MCCLDSVDKQIEVADVLSVPSENNNGLYNVCRLDVWLLQELVHLFF